MRGDAFRGQFLTCMRAKKSYHHFIPFVYAPPRQDFITVSEIARSTLTTPTARSRSKVSLSRGLHRRSTSPLATDRAYSQISPDTILRHSPALPAMRPLFPPLSTPLSIKQTMHPLGHPRPARRRPHSTHTRCLTLLHQNCRSHRAAFF